jgi:sensor histidine kinase regulating citrate/malate metabolism
MSSVYDALTKAGKKAETSGTLAVSWQGLSLEWKIMLVVLGLFFAVIVHQLVARVLRAQIEESAVLMTTNLSDAAAGYIASNDALRLKTTVTKYARLSRVAYVFVQDREGKIIASSLADFAAELRPAVTSNQDLQVSRRELSLDGKPVNETRAPILDGQLGSAHIGIWAGAVEGDIQQALFKFVWPITLGLLAAVTTVLMLGQPLIRALRRLIELRSAAQPTATQRLK